MKKLVPKYLAVALGFMAATLCPTQADTLTNLFSTPYDYVANGIIGDTNWDGVYLRLGDITGGNVGGNPAGATVTASTTVGFLPGYLAIRASGGDWAAAGDDGVFFWKLVDGDFDVSVQSSPYDLSGGTAFDNRNFQMAGLMARAYNPNNSGAPYSTTLATPAENYVMLLRFQEFNLNEVNEATNNARIEHTFPDGTSATDLAATRYFRMVRASLTNFTFFWKTNLSDTWVQITNNLPPGGTLVRNDLTGPLQVGIAQAAFNAAERDAVFTDFQLSGVNLPALPSAFPSDLAVSRVNSNTVSITWNTNGGDGSLVLVRANGPIISQPVQGRTYTADADFRSASSLLGAANTRAVYVGPATNVTVTGLGGSNNTYTVAVFTYSGSGNSTVYNTASPATNAFGGPGRVASVSFTVYPTSVPVGGVAMATVVATYDSEDSYDVSADTSTIWNSSDPSKIVATNGTLTGVAVGSALVSATYAGILGSANVETRAPAFSDNFSVNHDYLAKGVAGSGWDGIYMAGGDVPFQYQNGNAPLGANGAGVTTNCNANISSNNVLTVSSRSTGWEAAENDGFFLFKRVQGDFQASVHITAFNQVDWHFAGLQARVAGADGRGGGTTSTAYPLSRETHVNFWRFDRFSISTSTRLTRNNAENGGTSVRHDQNDGDTTQYWMLLMRKGNAFYMFKRASTNDPWNLIPGATANWDPAGGNVNASANLQVGIAQATFTANVGTALFDNFMLDGAGLNVAPPPTAPPSNLSFAADPATGWMTVSWTPAVGSDGTLVAMRAGKPVNQQPVSGVTYTADSNFGVGSNLGSSNFVVYMGPGSSVVVSNLIPGTTYYAAAYSYTGTSYNILNPVTGNQLALGAVSSIAFTVPAGNEIPKGGIAMPRVVATYSTGVQLDATAASQYYWDPADALTATNGVFTALSNTAVAIQAVYGGKTNTFAAVVREPTYTDNFGTSRNYLTSGVAGIWDGVYFGDVSMHPANSVPGGAVGESGPGYTTVCDANISSNNVLTVTSYATDWEFGDNDGFFLFSYVPGDFQVAVHLQEHTAIPSHNSGLLARAYSAGGAPASTNGESWLSWSRFDSWGIQTDARSTLDDGTARMENRDGSINMWLLLVRQSETNFYFFERATEADPWILRPTFNTVRADLAGKPLQVGLQAAVFAAVDATVRFDRFMLEAQGPELQITKSGSNVTLSWSGGGTLQVSPVLGPGESWTPVAGVSTIDGMNTVSVSAGTGNQFFRLVQ